MLGSGIQGLMAREKQLAEEDGTGHQRGTDEGQSGGFSEGFKERLQSIHDGKEGSSRRTRRSLV